MIPLVLLSLFLTSPAPLDMPRAEAFLVRENGRCRLEDRYDRFDLWTSQAVVGRWVDDDGRIFLLADLDVEPPTGGVSETLTRTAYAAQRVKMPRLRANRDVPRAFRNAIGLLAGCPLTEERPRRARQVPHGYEEVSYWQHPTNDASIVCAFRLERSEQWHLAVWTLAEGDDIVERTALLEDEFLRREYEDFSALRISNLRSRISNSAFRGSDLKSQVSHAGARSARERSRASHLSERELLRGDARHSVAAYSDWHVAESEEFTVLDDALSRDLVVKLTNEFASVRAKAVAVLPTPIDGSNALCVARIFASRAEYLEALETDGNTNMMWSAAYWSPQRRELVAYLPETGAAEFLKTVRHETFHQYLSYATSMMSVSPWLNEGYAQYFEDVEDASWGDGFDVSDEGLKRMAKALPAILALDYGAFYAGTDAERRFKYRLAWSIAVFLEKGAEKVRFRPFATLKHDYFKTLLETGDMRVATAAAFGKNQDTLNLFVSEWLKFWQSR